MKTLLLTIFLCSGIAFGQSKDLTKKQAYQMFLKSTVRKTLKIKTTEFDRIYTNEAQELSKDAVILNNMPKKELLYIKQYYYSAPFIDKEYIIYENKEGIKEKMKGFPL
ncbi:hypothetical protein CMU40_00100 [Elizabethkingia anophelis]|nr:hypothetical protein [Elizabethkingia anophelis]MDV3729917.1 hypothetical protein [Elizabethkingia anophelis]MDV3744746.1 hypothetical protein [Elizabethkingia anophelis]